MKKTIFIILVFTACLPAFVFASDSPLVDIQSIPDIDEGPPLLESIIGNWDGEGRIDAIYSGRIVINDMNFKTDNRLKLISIDGQPYSTTLKAGMFVYFFLESDEMLIKMAIDPKK